MPPAKRRAGLVRGLAQHAPAFLQSPPGGLSANAARPHAHVIVLVLGLLLYGQLLQRGVYVQLVCLQLPQQRLPLQTGSRRQTLLWPVAHAHHHPSWLDTLRLAARRERDDPAPAACDFPRLGSGR